MPHINFKAALGFLCLVPISITMATHVQGAIRSGSIRANGVNLGGWLVVEHWMTHNAGIWQGVPREVASKGEHATMQFLGHAKGDSRMEQHRASWVTEADIAEVARAGLNMVRVPVGFWIVGDDPRGRENDTSPNKDDGKVFTPGSLKYLDTLINSWAVTHNVAVLISLHAHRGSQNGRDHSAPSTFGVAQWCRHPSNVENSVAWALFLARRYQHSPAFLGLSLMNEPEHPTTFGVVLDYFARVHQTLRREGNNCVLVTAPLLTEQSPGAMTEFMRNAPQVWHEWHPYFKWGFEGKNEVQLVEAAGAYGARVGQWHGNPLLISEWSLGVWDHFAPFHDAELLRRFGRVQQHSYAGARGGMCFWSWRHADDDAGKRSGWSMRELIRAGLLNVA